MFLILFILIQIILGKAVYKGGGSYTAPKRTTTYTTTTTYHYRPTYSYSYGYHHYNVPIIIPVGYT